MTNNQSHGNEPGFFDKSIETHLEPFLKTEELAELLKVRPGTVLDWCQKHPDFPVHRLGHANRYRVSEVVAYFQRPKPKRKRRVRKRGTYDS